MILKIQTHYLSGKKPGNTGEFDSCRVIDQKSGKCRGKSCQGKLLIAVFTCKAVPVFSTIVHAYYCTVKCGVITAAVI